MHICSFSSFSATEDCGEPPRVFATGVLGIRSVSFPGEATKREYHEPFLGIHPAFAWANLRKCPGQAPIGYRQLRSNRKVLQKSPTLGMGPLCSSRIPRTGSWTTRNIPESSWLNGLKIDIPLGLHSPYELLSL